MIEDLTGKNFGYWTVLRIDEEKHNTRDIRWICQCKCGNVKSVLGKYLRTNVSTSCGCSKKVDLTGKRFGKLVVLETLYGYKGRKRATYKCKCDCGNITYIKSASIYKTSSCGCSYLNLRKDYTGKIFENVVVEEMLYNYKNRSTYCKCLCKCGKEFITEAKALVNGNTTSCGCKRRPPLIGRRFGRLKVIDQTENYNQQRCWICNCDCGNTIKVTSHQLLSNHTQSCGCLRSEVFSLRETLISNILSSNNIKFEREYSFSDCKGIGNKRLRFDFYIQNLNILIEYDGEQHFKPIEYFGGEEHYIKQVANDKIKNKYCLDHNIKLIRIPYTCSNEEVEKIILNIIQNPVTTTAA